MRTTRIIVLVLLSFLVPAQALTTTPTQYAPPCHVGDPSIDWYLNLPKSSQDKFINEYHKEFEHTYDMAVGELKNLFAAPYLTPILTKSRLKSIDSIQEKLTRKNYRCFRDMGDIIGLRIVIPDYATLSYIDHVVKERFSVDKVDVQISASPTVEYRAVHYDITIDGRRGEIQVHTRRSNLLADASHKLVYKGPYKDNTHVKDYVAALSYAIYLLDSKLNATLPDQPDGLPDDAKLCFSDLLQRLKSISLTERFELLPVCAN